MNDIDNPNIKLSTKEEIKFRDLTNKIINQQSLPEILSESDRREFFYLLKKLKLDPQIQAQDVYDNTKIIVGILSFLSVYIFFVGIPVAIALFLNLSSLSIIYIIAAATSMSVVMIGVLQGKVSWGMLAIVSGSILGTGSIIFFLLKRLNQL